MRLFIYAAVIALAVIGLLAVLFIGSLIFLDTHNYGGYGHH